MYVYPGYTLDTYIYIYTTSQLILNWNNLIQLMTLTSFDETVCVIYRPVQKVLHLRLKYLSLKGGCVPLGSQIWQWKILFIRVDI